MRRHVVAGEVRVVLQRGTDLIVVGAREQIILACADGSRDLAGIRAAARREGVRVSDQHLAEFLAALAAREMLVGGVEGSDDQEGRADAVAGVDAADSADSADSGDYAERPLRRLAGFALQCTGAGSCCRSYATILFSPLEAARARAARPDVLNGGVQPSALFTPAGRGLAVAMVDGRCAFLSRDDRCSLHAFGKPAGCTAFPAVYVDDGETLRAGPAPKCECVFDSAGGGTAQASWPPPPGVHTAVVTLPLLSDGLSRAEIIACDDVLGRRDADVPGLLVAAAGSRDPHAPPVADAWRQLDSERAVLAARLERLIARHRWRHPDDLARVVPDWLQHALTQPPPPPTPAQRDDERFWLQAQCHLHAWATAGEPLVTVWREAALRVLLARALSAPAAAAGFAHPLALVEAIARGYGI